MRHRLTGEANSNGEGFLTSRCWKKRALKCKLYTLRNHPSRVRRKWRLWERKKMNSLQEYLPLRNGCSTFSRQQGNDNRRGLLSSEGSRQSLLHRSLSNHTWWFKQNLWCHMRSEMVMFKTQRKDSCLFLHLNQSSKMSIVGTALVYVTICTTSTKETI